jgi:hypothetical protein
MKAGIGMLACILSVLFVIAPAAAEEKCKSAEKGFISLFNGKDLEGWKGDSRLWTVKDGVIHGETTKEKPAHGNTFLVWQGGKPRNYIFKLKFRVGNSNNSGVQFRSKVVGKEGSKNPWVVSGYQAEVEEKPGKVGFLYHEKGRGWLVNVGDIMVIEPGEKKPEKKVVGKVGNVKKMIEAGYYKSNKDPEAWNEYTITCRGNHVMINLNGFQTMELIDNDKEGRCMEGVLALQLHGGAPMWVEFKDIRLKELKENYGEALRLFNGKDLKGWSFVPETLKDVWSVKDGVLVNLGKPRGYIRTDKDYTNFVIRMQVRHLTKGNGGVLLRAVGADKVWPKSIECQGMVENKGDIWNIGRFPMKVAEDRTKGRRTKKIHDSNEKPMGEWNEYEMTINKGDLRILVNGLTQNIATECEEVPGKICLQSEGSHMEFRNIVLIPIEK